MELHFVEKTEAQLFYTIESLFYLLMARFIIN